MRASPMIPPANLSDVPESQAMRNTRRNMYAVLLFALLINFACIFSAMWLGLNLRPFRPLETSILAHTSADYGANFDFEFAPLDPTIAAASETDSVQLRGTGTAVSLTPDSIIPFPLAGTPTNTSYPTRETSTPIPSKTATPTPTKTNTAVPPTATRTPIPTSTASKTAVPTIWPTSQPSSTATQPPIWTPTPQPPTSTNTPIPGNTPTPSAAPSATATQPPTATPSLMPSATASTTPLPSATPSPSPTNTPTVFVTASPIPGFTPGP